MTHTRYTIETEYQVLMHVDSAAEATLIASRLAHETGERVAVYREDRNRVWDSCYPDNGTHESSGLT